MKRCPAQTQEIVAMKFSNPVRPFISAMTGIGLIYLAANMGQLAAYGQGSSEPVQTMSKEDFGKRVREFLLENPEVLAEAMEKLQAKDQAAQKRVLQTVLETR